MPHLMGTSQTWLGLFFFLVAAVTVYMTPASVFPETLPHFHTQILKSLVIQTHIQDTLSYEWRLHRFESFIFSRSGSCCRC